MARNARQAKQNMGARADVIPTKRPEVYKAEYAGYLVCDLLEKHDKELEKFKPSEAEIFTWLEEQVDSGRKLVLTYSKDGASVRAELHEMHIDDDLAGWRLSAFADCVINALIVLYFKDTVILSGDWSLAARERSKRGYG